MIICKELSETMSILDRSLISGSKAGVFTTRPPPQTRDNPKARLNNPSNQPQKFWNVPEVYKIAKVLEDGREKGFKKSVFHLDFRMQILKS